MKLTKEEIKEYKKSGKPIKLTLDDMQKGENLWKSLLTSQKKNNSKELKKSNQL